MALDLGWSDIVSTTGYVYTNLLSGLLPYVVLLSLALTGGLFGLAYVFKQFRK